MRVRLSSIAAILTFIYMFAEIAVFIIVSRQIGVMATLIIVMLSTALGLAALRGQWTQFLREVRGIMRNGAMPDAIPAKLLLSSCGAVLMILPGLISSVLGLIVLIPLAQDWLIKLAVKKGGVKTEVIYEERNNDKTEEVKIINLNAEEYHARDPENSPWRKQ